MQPLPVSLVLLTDIEKDPKIQPSDLECHCNKFVLPTITSQLLLYAYPGITVQCCPVERRWFRTGKKNSRNKPNELQTLAENEYNSDKRIIDWDDRPLKFYNQEIQFWQCYATDSISNAIALAFITDYSRFVHRTVTIEVNSANTSFVISQARLLHDLLQKYIMRRVCIVIVTENCVVFDIPFTPRRFKKTEKLS